MKKKSPCKNALIPLLLLLFLSCNSKPAAQEVRKSVLAGSWYSAEPRKLAATIDTLLDKAPVKRFEEPLLLILPHAGYQYSGMVAASGYRILRNAHPDIIVILAPSHHSFFHGCSILPVDYYETPLGTVRVEKEIAQKLLEMRLFSTERSAHRREHAIEIQLPFLQRLFADLNNSAGILPILVGDIDNDEALAISKHIIDAIREKKKPLFIISTDFTHYGAQFGYVPFSGKGAEFIKKLTNLDHGAIQSILDRDIEAFTRYVKRTGITICGKNPIKVALSLPIQNFSASLIGYDTSGNITGDYHHSVSYASIVFCGTISRTVKKETFTLTDADKRFLIDLARRNIQSVLFHNTFVRINKRAVPRTCQLNRGAFVTLKIRDKLRGCIGYLEGRKPLYQTIIENSYNAAFRDHRFHPVRQSELKDITIEISVLTEPEEIRSIDDIAVGRDGLIVRRGSLQGVLLPQVPLQWGWSREEFLVNTCRKASLPDDAWREKGTRIYRFQALVFNEHEMQ